MSRLQLNPGPLRIVKRRELATVRELAEGVRCRATTKKGHQCARIQAPDSDYCRQHGTMENHA